MTVTVTDNDDAGVTVVPDTGLPVGEGDTGTYTVVLNSQPSGAVTVTAASADSGAVTVTPTVLTFTPGNWDTAQTVTVTAVDDDDADDESVNVSHTAASSDDAAYNGLAGDVVTVTVTDNDDAGVTVVPDTGLLSPVGEGDTGTYTVVLNSQPSGAVTVTASSADSGAVTVTPTVLTFTPGNWDTDQTVTVTAVDDDDADDESVNVSHTAASSDDAAYNGLAGDVVTVTVTDNDDAGVTVEPDTGLPVDEGDTGTYTVVLNSQPSGAVTVTAASADAGAVTVTPTVLTFTPGNWDTDQTVTVTAVDDDDADDESVNVSHTAASSDDAAYNGLAGDVVTVTVTDNDDAGVTVEPDTGLLSPVGEGDTGTYTVVLDSQPSGAVTVTAASADVGAVTVSPVSLTFTTGNWDTAQTVTVTAEQDDDADNESVDVSHTAASAADAVYNGLAGDVVTVTVTDNDDAGVTVVPDTGLSVGEGDTGTYTVVLDSQPSGAVTVTAASADSGAVTVTPDSLTFTPGNWDTAQTVTVTAEQDDDADDESVDVSHTAASSDDAAYNGLAGDVVTVTVTDNDDAGVTVEPDTGLPVDEGDTGTYTVVLNSQPSGAVTVTAASADAGAVTVTPTVLTFTPGNWDTAQTVTVTAVDDDDADDESVDVSHTAASSDDAAYNGLAGDVVTVTVTDNDDAGVTVEPDTGLPVGEGDTGTYTVVLDSQPSGAVTVTAASADVGAVTVSPTVLTFTPGNWDTAQTVTVTALDDDDADDESVDVSHTAASSVDAAYNGLAGDVVTVTVTDNDDAGVTVVPDTGLPVGEGDTGTYTVVLNSQPSGAVTVTAASADSGAVTVTPTVLTFTPGNWDTAQTVTVTAWTTTTRTMSRSTCRTRPPLPTTPPTTAWRAMW